MMKNDAKTIELPEGINKTDLEYPSWESIKRDETNRISDTFEIWYTERFGWCIPTLLISKAGRKNRTSNVQDRTYATTLKGECVRIGKGPHVLQTNTVYVRGRRKADLQKFLDIKTNGESSAGDIRDGISTRRAQTALRRSKYDFLSNAW